MIADLWPALLLNFLFWSGLAVGVPVFVALLDVTHATWSEPLRVVAFRFCRFLPVAFVIYLVVFGSAGTIRMRDAVALTAAFGVAFWFGRSTRRPSAPMAIALLMIYVTAFSIVAVDLIMALEPDWVSTLFPAYVLTSNVYAAIAALAFAAGIMLPPDRFTRAVMGDVAAVLLGFAFIWIYFTWTQVLVIWYGNVPSETRYIAERIAGGWQWVAWSVVVTLGLVPVVVLLPRFARRPMPIAVVAFIIMAGYWAECWLLIGPALVTRTTALVTVTAAFGLLFAGCIALPPRPAALRPAGAHAVGTDRR